MEDLIDGNRTVLREAIAVLKLVDDREYSCVPAASHGSSIGENLRHVTDHYLALLLTALGKQVPQNFGVAPTTLRWRRQQSLGAVPVVHQEPRAAAMG